MAAITTDDELQLEIGTLASGKLGGVPQINPVLQDASQVPNLTGTSLGTPPVAGTTTANPTDIVTTAPTVSSDTLGQVGATTNITPNLGTMANAQITPEGDYVSDVQGTVSSGSLAVAQTDVLDEKATTQYQLSQLMSSIEDGTEMPAWASPAVRKVGAIMQARGLGASSMASAAITQAIMESGVVIATQDANKYAAIQLQNLNNKQQSALSRAATYAAMDKSNLSARLQGAVTNAQALLSVDTKNLDAIQKTLYGDDKKIGSDLVDQSTTGDTIAKQLSQMEKMKEDALGSNILPRRRATGPTGQEVEQGPLLSKVPTPKKREMSPETYARQKRTGQRRRGEYAPPASMVGEEMGMGGRGSEMMPTGKELEELISSGFEIKKYGGKVRRRMGGQVRGYGKALRGY